MASKIKARPYQTMSLSKIPVIGIVACLIPEMGIGFQGTLPWRLSKEMKYFKQITSSTNDPKRVNAVVMGRKTWESIPQRFRPLPNRVNLIVSRSYEENFSQQTDVENCYQSNSLPLGIQELKQKLGHRLERIYIIGGGEIYNQCYDLTDHWLVTKIKPLQLATIPEMDTFLDKDKLQEQFSESTSEELSSFLPTEVYLPGLMEEKGFQFWITLYNKKST